MAFHNQLYKFHYNKYILCFIIVNIFNSYCSITHSKKRFNTHVSTSVANTLQPSNNDPWYSDTNIPKQCDFTYSTNLKGPTGQRVLEISMVTAPSSTVCLAFGPPGQPTYLALKLKHSSNIHDTDSREWCGSFAKFETLHDPLKPEIKNGISCHCPLGYTDAKFGECENKTIFTDNLNFINGFPSSDKLSLFEMCHTLNSRGTALGCDIAEGTTTDYYMKIASFWNFYPVFTLKKRDITEVVFSVYTVSNFSSDDYFYHGDIFFSKIGQTVLNISNAIYGTRVIDIFNQRDLVSDYIISSASTNFTNPGDIYLIPQNDFNLDDNFDSGKFCPIKKFPDTGLMYRQWDVENRIKEVFQPTTCHPANGIFNAPFPRLEDAFITKNKLDSRLNIQGADFIPGESSTLKIQTEVQMTFQLLFPDTYEFSGFISTGAVQSFEFTCSTSINEEGYPCTATFKFTGSLVANIIAEDNRQTITMMTLTEGISTYDFFLNTIYTSVNKTTLCACVPPKEICHTHQLVIIEEHKEDPENFPDVNDDIDNTEGGNIFQNAKGRLQTWLIIIIVLLSLIGLIIFVLFIMPLIKGVYYTIRLASKKIIKSVNSAKERLNYFNKKHSEPVVDDKEFPIFEN